VKRAFIDGEEEGFAALYTRKSSTEIVGAILVAAHVGEMISELRPAIANKLTMHAHRDSALLSYPGRGVSEDCAVA
jgi:pyruvate/2-oxoglutarate dehydrogenase complex dihydrolipoamide dehydrogenase (E3) component